MPLFVKRNDIKQTIRVRKYIIDDQQEESIWSNEWYGRHIIGKDCEWAKHMSGVECPHCKFLNETFCNKEYSEREYWLMTEVFVYLHGSDICV